MSFVKQWYGLLGLCRLGVCTTLEIHTRTLTHIPEREKTPRPSPLDAGVSEKERRSRGGGEEEYRDEQSQIILE